MAHGDFMGKKFLIHHIIAIWDECDHVSRKNSSRLSEKFWRGYLSAFPNGKNTNESPAVVETISPMFSISRVKEFWHDGKMVPYKGKNKDLAIAKFCSSGFMDQDGVFHFIVDDMRRMRYERGDPPMYSNEAIMVVFCTSDSGKGMWTALQIVMKNTSKARTHFIFIQVDQNLAKGEERMTNAGYILGQEIKSRLVKIKDGGLLLELDNLIETKSTNPAKSQI